MEKDAALPPGGDPSVAVENIPIAVGGDVVVVVKTGREWLTCGGRCRRRSPPCYAAAMFAVYVALFYAVPGGFGSPAFDALALDTAQPAARRAWTWYTYSLMHGSTTHLWVNMMGWVIYATAVELDNGVLRSAAIHVCSVVGGAFATGWQARLTRPSPPIVVVGASGGVYGMLGAQVGNLAINWAELGTVERFAYISALGSTVAIDAVIAGVLRDPSVSYSAHVGGFVVGALAGAALMVNRRALPWERWLRIGAAVALGVYAAVGVAGLL